jgi:hypothetical protein
MLEGWVDLNFNASTPGAFIATTGCAANGPLLSSRVSISIEAFHDKQNRNGQ